MISLLRWAWSSRGTSRSGGSREQHRCSSHSSTLVTVVVVIAFTLIWKMKQYAYSDAIGRGGIVDLGCHGWTFGRGGGGRRLFRCCWCCWSRNFRGGFVFLPKLGIFFHRLFHWTCNEDVSAVVVPASDSIKFNSPAVVSNFFGASPIILGAPSLVSVGMGASAASAIVYSILNASTSTSVIFRDYSSTVSSTISATPWIIRLAAPASDSINFNSSYTISNLLCASAAVLSAPSHVSVGMGASAASIMFYRTLSASASSAVISFDSSYVASILSASCPVVYSWINLCREL